MLEHFDYLYFSDEGGRSKPHPDVFRSVLERLGVRAAEAVHVGDMQRTDIEGAHAVGMWAIHFVGANDRDAAASTADAVTRHFEQVPRLIGDLMCPGCGLPGGGLGR
jgi:putative hydrolase of the HAD superfamily